MKHLPRHTAAKPISMETTCPSNNPHGIQCSCVRRPISKRFEINGYGTVLVLPPPLLAQWITEFDKWLDRKKVPLVARCAHNDTKNHTIVPRLTRGDWRYCDPRGVPATTRRMLCFTTPRSYHLIDDAFTFKETREEEGAKGKKRITEWVRYRAAWGIIVFDEAHKYCGGGSVAHNLIAPHRTALKFLLTGTPFESGPMQMWPWLANSNIGRWQDKPSIRTLLNGPSWQNVGSLKDADLGLCTYQNFKDLDRRFKALVRIWGTGNRQDLKPVCRGLANILHVLVIQRTPASLFLGDQLIRLKPHVQCQVDCYLQKRYKTSINEGAEKVLKDLRTEMKEKAIGRKSAGIKSAPTMQLHSFLTKVRRQRLFSTFPELSKIREFNDLNLTGEELNKKGWLIPDTGDRFHQLKATNSPYQSHMDALTNPDNCAKMAVILALIKRDPTGKIVFFTFSPVTAFILYWVSYLDPTLWLATDLAKSGPCATRPQCCDCYQRPEEVQYQRHLSALQ